MSGSKHAALQLLVTLALASRALADDDQLEVTDRDTALRISALVRSTDTVRVYGPRDTTAELLFVRNVMLVRVFSDDVELYEVRLDGWTIDAAFTYVLHAGAWTNVGVLLDLGVIGRPSTLPPALVTASSDVPIAPHPQTTSPTIPLTGGCTLSGDEHDLLMRCESPHREPRFVEGICRPLAEVELAVEPGPETVVECDLADESGVIVVSSNGALRYAMWRAPFEGLSATFEDIVPNGEGLLELVIGGASEDGRTVDIVATRGAEWINVFALDLGGGHASTGASRMPTFGPPSAPAVAVRVRNGRRSRVERWSWDTTAFRFVRTHARR